MRSRFNFLVSNRFSCALLNGCCVLGWVDFVVVLGILFGFIIVVGIIITPF